MFIYGREENEGAGGHFNCVGKWKYRHVTIYQSWIAVCDTEYVRVYTKCVQVLMRSAETIRNWGVLENDICCHFPVVSCASLALLRHYCDKYAASMQQEQDDKNSAIVKEKWVRKLLFYFTGKNIIFYDDVIFWVLHTRRRPVNLVSLSSHVLVLLVHRDSSLKQHQR